MLRIGDSCSVRIAKTWDLERKMYLFGVIGLPGQLHEGLMMMRLLLLRMIMYSYYMFVIQGAKR